MLLFCCLLIYFFTYLNITMMKIFRSSSKEKAILFLFIWFLFSIFVYPGNDFHSIHHTHSINYINVWAVNTIDDRVTLFRMNNKLRCFHPNIFDASNIQQLIQRQNNQNQYVALRVKYRIESWNPLWFCSPDYCQINTETSSV